MRPGGLRESPGYRARSHRVASPSECMMQQRVRRPRVVECLDLADHVPDGSVVGDHAGRPAVSAVDDDSRDIAHAGILDLAQAGSMLRDRQGRTAGASQGHVRRLDQSDGLGGRPAAEHTHRRLGGFGGLGPVPQAVDQHDETLPLPADHRPVVTAFDLARHRQLTAADREAGTLARAVRASRRGEPRRPSPRRAGNRCRSRPRAGRWPPGPCPSEPAVE